MVLDWMSMQDFWEMFIHHLATLALLTLSWSNHMHRMGSLVLIVHDFADHWLEMAKLLRYAGWAKSCDACFGIFTLVWAFSRLGLFPSWVCYSTITGAGQVELTSDMVDRQECKMFQSMSSGNTMIGGALSIPKSNCYLLILLGPVKHS